jgi:DNA-binding MarR family transcriptional regulator
MADIPDPKTFPRADSRPGATAQRPALHEPKGGGAAGSALLFLREEEMRLAQDMLLLAYRDFASAADATVAELGLSRAHHRALHHIGRNPGIAVGELLGLLRVTKQSLGRVLGALIAEGYVTQSPGPADRRQRLLSLTPQGQALERRLFERQKERLAAAYREAGGSAVEGFRRVMRGIMEPAARAYVDRVEAAHRQPRLRPA